jgi:hypothetical protein
VEKELKMDEELRDAEAEEQRVFEEGVQALLRAGVATERARRKARDKALEEKEAKMDDKARIGEALLDILSEERKRFEAAVTALSDDLSNTVEIPWLDASASFAEKVKDWIAICRERLEIARLEKAIEGNTHNEDIVRKAPSTWSDPSEIEKNYTLDREAFIANAIDGATTKRSLIWNTLDREAFIANAMLGIAEKEEGAAKNRELEFFIPDLLEDYLGGDTTFKCIFNPYHEFKEDGFPHQYTVVTPFKYISNEGCEAVELKVNVSRDMRYIHIMAPFSGSLYGISGSLKDSFLSVASEFGLTLQADNNGNPGKILGILTNKDNFGRDFMKVVHFIVIVDGFRYLNERLINDFI